MPVRTKMGIFVYSGEHNEQSKTSIKGHIQ